MSTMEKRHLDIYKGNEIRYKKERKERASEHMQLFE